MSENIENCPLCGKEPKAIDCAGWEIFCDCGIGFVIDSPIKADVIKAWNTRTPAQPTNEVE